MNEGDDWMNWNETLRNNVTRAQELKTYMRLTSQEEEHMTRILEPVSYTHLDVYKRQGEHPDCVEHILLHGLDRPLGYIVEKHIFFEMCIRDR